MIAFRVKGPESLEFRALLLPACVTLSRNHFGVDGLSRSIQPRRTSAYRHDQDLGCEHHEDIRRQPGRVICQPFQSRCVTTREQASSRSKLQLRGRRRPLRRFTGFGVEYLNHGSCGTAKRVGRFLSPRRSGVTGVCRHAGAGVSTLRGSECRSPLASVPLDASTAKPNGTTLPAHFH